MRRLRAQAAGGLLIALVSGCGVFRDGVMRPSVNDCVAAIPVGQALVGKTSDLVRLRRVELEDTQALLARLKAPLLSRADAQPPTAAPTVGPTAGPTGGPAKGPRPCVLVFAGSFNAATLAAAPGISGLPSGGYVVLVTTTRHPRVLRTVIPRTDPLR